MFKFNRNTPKTEKSTTSEVIIDDSSLSWFDGMGLAISGTVTNNKNTIANTNFKAV